MKASMHDRIESLAGAIALGEASEAEVREYREHIAGCAACLHTLGGEMEIVRTAQTVAAAREGEIWQPDLRNAVASRERRRSQLARYGISAVLACLGVAFGAHFLIVSGLSRLDPSRGGPVVFAAGSTRIVLEQNTAAAVPKATPPPRRLIVTHNVVQIARTAVVTQRSALPAHAQATASIPPPEIETVTVHPDAPPARAADSKIPIWRRGEETWRTVARTTTTSLSETAPQTLTHSAESIQIAPASIREAAPVGGETAINPQPSMIAYDEGAQGTTVFEVLIDNRGTPAKCVITKSAGYPVLDDAVCRAAMKARFIPKTIDGRPVSGIYRDAFTFRMSDAESGADALPKAIQ